METRGTPTSAFSYPCPSYYLYIGKLNYFSYFGYGTLLNKDTGEFSKRFFDPQGNVITLTSRLTPSLVVTDDTRSGSHGFCSPELVAECRAAGYEQLPHSRMNTIELKLDRRNLT